MLILTPLLKGTGYSLYPAAALGLAAVLWRERSWQAAGRVAAAVATAAALFAGWSLLAPVFHRAAFVTPTGRAPGVGWPAAHNIRGYLSYLVQVFIPRPPFLTRLWQLRWPAFDIYVVRGWGAFGWYAQDFSHWVYDVIAAAMLSVGALACLGLWRMRRAAARIRLPLIVLVAAIAGVVAGVHFAYYSPFPRALYLIPEMGRYTFPAITALAVVALGSAFAFGRRLVVPVATTLAVAVMMTGFVGQITELARFYAG
jgi:hypothetical protein